MRFGLALPSYSFADLDYRRAARLRDFAIEVEARGYESLWAIEHLLTARGLYGTAWLSPLETLSFAAGCTSRIALATGILIAALRNPVFVAKEIASLQYLSGGRFELGIGVGWDAHEYQVAGVPLRERGRRTDEILGIFERLWTGEPVTHHGRYYHFDDVVIDPPLPKKPPLWLAGGSKIVTELSPDPENMAPTVLERICRPGHHRPHFPGQCRELFDRGVEPVPRARMAGLRGGQVVRGRDPHPRRRRPLHRFHRAPRSRRRAPGALCPPRRARECAGRDGLWARHPGRPRVDLLGQVRGDGRGRPARHEDSVGAGVIAISRASRQGPD
jgi:hypothetical protein